MAEFKSRALIALDRIYDRITGQQAPTAIDTTGPIQLVHDVSRMVEIGSGQANLSTSGLVTSAVGVTHGGADTQQAAFDPYAQSAVNLAWLAEDVDSWYWLYRFSIQFAANVDPAVTVSAYVQGGSPFPQLDSGDFPLYSTATGAGIEFNEGADTVGVPELIRGAGAMPAVLPFPIFRGGSVRLFSVGAAAGAVRLNLMGWAGKIGTFPPGLR